MNIGKKEIENYEIVKVKEKDRYVAGERDRKLDRYREAKKYWRK